ncbi:hypothetical protein J7J00_24915 [Bacillus sp. ISL-4]|nr:hypothetical protein [Bacillus sp. ISL-4]MBT2669725.1 hypothetical protein [Streptomyces sp. ISL-14]
METWCEEVACFSGEVLFVPQYDDRNSLQALENGSATKEATIREEYEFDSISCLVGEKYGSEVQEKIK